MKLKEFAIINMGQSPKGETYNTIENGMPFLQGRKTFGRIYPSIDTWTTNPIKIANKSEILMSVRAPVGDMNFADQKICIGRGLCSINAKNGKNKYLYYILLNSMNDIKQKSTGTVFDSINRNDLENLEIDFHSEEEQNKIENILGNIDIKIELNNEINNNLRELCRTNYLRIIEENSVEISLSELMDYQGGSQPPASEFQKEKNEDNIRFVQIRDFETDSYICYIPNSNKNKLCNKDDILIARYGASLGRICYGLSGAYNVALAKVLPKKAEYKELLRVILESDDFYNYINQVGQRSAQAGFNAGDIAGYSVIIPNENGLKIFNSISKNIIDKRLLMIEENRKLSELRDTLLPKLMNGEIDLDDIEI